MRNVRNVGRYIFGAGAAHEVARLVDARRETVGASSAAVFLIDSYFETRQSLLPDFGIRSDDVVRYVETSHEPTTSGIDQLMRDLRDAGALNPACIVGVGGGATLDTAKAAANLYTNAGRAADYQGWDLVKNPGVYKIGVPTLSGTGAESSRTCVMTNTESGLKLGMNSDHTLFDQLVLDPSLTATVDRNQYFFTGMDTYVHGIESLAGRYRNAVGDALSQSSVAMCRQVFAPGDDMMSDENRERLMLASYFGGQAIATGFVGVVHPVSAALSVVLGTHHCVANCITMRAMAEFYPRECAEFWAMAEAQGVSVPLGVASGLPDEEYRRMAASALLHEKPLANALGPQFRDILTVEKLTELFRRM